MIKNGVVLQKNARKYVGNLLISLYFLLDDNDVCNNKLKRLLTNHH